MQTAREIPIFRALNRPQLIMGCDRELLIISGVVAGILIFILQTWLTFAVGAILWLAALLVLRRMATADPLMRQVFVRHLRYRTLYRAGASGLGALGRLPEQPRLWRSRG